MPHGTIKFYIIIHSHSELLNPNDLEYMCTTIVQSIFGVLMCGEYGWLVVFFPSLVGCVIRSHSFTKYINFRYTKHWTLYADSCWISILLLTTTENKEYIWHMLYFARREMCWRRKNKRQQQTKKTDRPICVLESENMRINFRELNFCSIITGKKYKWTFIMPKYTEGKTVFGFNFGRFFCSNFSTPSKSVTLMIQFFLNTKPI